MSEPDGSLENDRQALLSHQQQALRRLLAVIAGSPSSATCPGNPFYRRKLASLGADLEAFTTPGRFVELPFTTKDELVADQERTPPFGSNLSCPIESYVRVHQTSGTSGRPLRWLDTAASWRAYLDCWRRVYRASGVTAADRVLVAFSFGPFIGFWGAFEAAQQIGVMAVTGGGQSSAQRLDQMLEVGATVLVSTPTYALHLAEVAEQRGLDLGRSAIRLTIHAGEPGASVPAVRRRIEEVWGAPCFDHAGATELGAWGYPGRDQELDRLYIYEPSFLAEVIDPTSGRALEVTDQGTRGELVLTSLTRFGSPLLRYRTGDLVELCQDNARRFLRGGILARIDDMFVVRGVNVYPAAIENVVRELPEIGEFRATVSRRSAMAELVLEIEVNGGDAETVGRALGDRLQRRLSIRVPISTVATGSLPRFELKAKRFHFAPRA